MSDQNPPGATPSNPAYPAYPTTPDPASGYAPFPRGSDQGYLRQLPPPSKTKATWALILAFIPAVFTWIAAVVLAIQVLSASRDGREHGKGMAIAALVVIPLWIALIAAVLIGDAADDADRDASGAVSRSGEVLVTEVRAGDCIVQEFDDKMMYTVDVTPCTGSHALETYATFDLARGDYPGAKEVERLSTIGCVDRFEAFVGVDASKSALEIAYILPSESSWEKTRAVACVVSEGKASTGTLKDSRR